MQSTSIIRRLILLSWVSSAVVVAQSVPTRKDIPAIAKAANQAIVTIITASGDKPISQGTGFIVSADGVIVTNYHVIKEGNKAIAKFSDGTVLPVDGVLAADKHRDLAIIKIQGKFRTLILGNSDRVQVGEEVVAIGNPLGLELTVSNGIVSGLRTDKEVGGKFLQTTAPISPGSSGGPLFNMLGEVVGINTMYLEGGENLNFAIPINDAKLLLSNQSATLQSLPNEEEAPTKVSKTREDPAVQQTCDKQAEKFAGYERKEYSHVTYPFKSGGTNHYDAGTGRCYVEVVLDFGADRNPLEGMNGAWFEGRMYFIYDASVEGSGSPEYASFSESEHHESCNIQPSGRPNIRCRSEEEFNELALKYFGVIQATTTLVVMPPKLQQIGPWPPTMKIAAETVSGGTTEQIYEDRRYCYRNPSESLYKSPISNNVLEGVPMTCNELNANTKAAENACRASKNRSKDCDGFLRFMEDVKAGL